MRDNRCQGSDGHQDSHPVQVVLVVDHGQNLHATNITVMLYCKYIAVSTAEHAITTFGIFSNAEPVPEDLLLCILTLTHKPLLAGQMSGQSRLPVVAY